jgi:hypothetical protein
MLKNFVINSFVYVSILMILLVTAYIEIKYGYIAGYATLYWFKPVCIAVMVTLCGLYIAAGRAKVSQKQQADLDSNTNVMGQIGQAAISDSVFQVLPERAEKSQDMPAVK